MRPHPILLAIATSFLSTLASTGCAVATDEETSQDDAEIREGGVQEFTLSFSTLENSRWRSPKAAEMKIKGRTAPEQLARCHQYSINGWNSDIVACRDGKREVIMDATYAMDDNFTRWARIRTPNGADQMFVCKLIAEEDFSGEVYGGAKAHRCKPKSAITAQAKKFFAKLDAAPEFTEFPVRTPYLQTNWAKDRPETWASWKKKIGAAAPVGEYTGFGRTGSKKCKVKISEKGDGYEVEILSLDDNGNEGRVNARIELSSTLTFGAHRQDSVPQQVASATRPASILVASAETSTATSDYHARNFRVVRYPDAPASADAGHTAMFIDDNYCQRLSPALPAF